jgi:hypothetical protein
MTQPPLALARPFQLQLDREDGGYPPIEITIHEALREEQS